MTRISSSEKCNITKLNNNMIEMTLRNCKNLAPVFSDMLFDVRVNIFQLQVNCTSSDNHKKLGPIIGLLPSQLMDHLNLYFILNNV